MAKKRAVSARDSVMFPPPPKITLPARKVVAFDPDSRTITLEGPTPPELIELHRRETERHDFIARANRYTENCIRAVWPHYGSRPPNITKRLWNNAKWRIQHVDLPGDAPGVAHDAQLALRCMNRVVELLKPHDWPDAFSAAFCELIDFGKLLQRMDDRRFEQAVAVALAIDENRKKSNASKSADSLRKQQDAVAEMERRKTKNTRLTVDAIAQEMAREKKWGALPTLRKYFRGLGNSRK